jgi:hypothetical protein
VPNVFDVHADGLRDADGVRDLDLAARRATPEATTFLAM